MRAPKKAHVGGRITSQPKLDFLAIFETHLVTSLFVIYFLTITIELPFPYTNVRMHNEMEELKEGNHFNYSGLCFNLIFSAIHLFSHFCVPCGP